MIQIEKTGEHAAVSNVHPGHRADPQAGKIAVMLAVLLPVIFGIAAIVMDGSHLVKEHQHLQQTADTIALSTAVAVMQMDSLGDGIAEGFEFASSRYPEVADVSIDSPPSTGDHAGKSGYIQVHLKIQEAAIFSRILNGLDQNQVVASSTVRIAPSGVNPALVVLDKIPTAHTIGGLPLGLASSFSLAGLEIEGLGMLEVAGAVNVNCEHGGFDEHGKSRGAHCLPPFGLTCFPSIGLTRLQAEEIRVVGGVDNPHFYESLGGAHTSLKAFRLPVRDPFRELPVPVPGDGQVDATEHGHVHVLNVPLVGNLLPPLGNVVPALLEPTVLEPGVYDWIEVIAGKVIFNPGIYYIRGRHPITKYSLAFLGGEVEAEGVMFYIAGEGMSSTLPLGVTLPVNITELTPSVLVSPLVICSHLSGLAQGGSPYDGMLFYQNRCDRRPMVFVTPILLGQNILEGGLYAKTAHLMMTGCGTYNIAAVAGSMRFIPIGHLHIEPTMVLPPSEEVQMAE